MRRSNLANSVGRTPGSKRKKINRASWIKKRMEFLKKKKDEDDKAGTTAGLNPTPFPGPPPPKVRFVYKTSKKHVLTEEPLRKISC